MARAAGEPGLLATQTPRLLHVMLWLSQLIWKMANRSAGMCFTKNLGSTSNHRPVSLINSLIVRKKSTSVITDYIPAPPPTILYHMCHWSDYATFTTAWSWWWPFYIALTWWLEPVMVTWGSFMFISQQQKPRCLPWQNVSINKGECIVWPFIDATQLLCITIFHCITKAVFHVPAWWPNG